MSQIQLSAVALNDVSKPLNLNLCTGQFVALCGDIGEGCEDFIAMLFGEHSPNQGKVRYNGEPIPHAAKALTQWRRKGVMLVAWRLPLIECLSVVDNLVLALQIHGVAPLRAYKQIHAALAEDDLTELLNCCPEQLNHMQHVQLLLWRALLCKPELLLVESLFSELPASLRERWSLRFKALCQSRHSIVIVHATEIAMMSQYADYVLAFVQGECVANGFYDDLSSAGLWSSERLLSAESAENSLQMVCAGQLAQRPVLQLDYRLKADVALDAMQKVQSSYAYLLDGKQLVGGLSLYQVNRAIQQMDKPLKQFIDHLPTIQADQPLSDVIAQGAARQRDLAVINQQNEYLGQLRYKPLMATLSKMLSEPPVH
ncbi:ATP-binding cassette domain-containing protein [Celerinatantimonas yamalensis]|uniref:ATP-binding cassette domain-containing protein n=1 Tax=Celerinatantimonas yamalensis TaxID=559956 RepID=A0ABW9G4Q0_9GAMM